MIFRSRAYYLFLRALFGTIAWFFFRLRIEGAERLPRTGGVLAIANHTSAVDPPIAGLALLRPARIMAKEELLRIPLIGPFLRSGGAFPVRRGEADRRALRMAQEFLAQGDVVLMFPEGTRSPDGRLQPVQPGAALLALRAGAPVLPIAIIGGHRAMPRGARFPRRIPVVARVGPPIEVPRLGDRIDRETVERWGALLRDALAALLPDDQRPLA
ncbi:MAG: lysophospholipid acyltransferase family protein [Armatimonadota bacterium]|nr:lysophospholipid acyltransferase family protein [Armatimonadota bacterium]MDR7421704.1 lysophospholipid acyltransferase family protein [Armatimonadota bacterium]MDR7455485.1 lysophospholipid acyltransferase family protein [Armatimonadota bacterium]MDR7457856.1 lysophospholipid acyltransferase family protein [Armatimonadota bacterium]MDR7495824.1 lysophospholipid acyltransferase family protein [Armatimonadota bacterium]